MLDFQTEKSAPAPLSRRGKKKAFRAARKTRRKLMFYECELSCINFNINFSPRQHSWDLPSSTKYMGPIETDKLNCVCRTGRARRLLRSGTTRKIRVHLARQSTRELACSRSSLPGPGGDRPCGHRGHRQGQDTPSLRTHADSVRFRETTRVTGVVLSWSR